MNTCAHECDLVTARANGGDKGQKRARGLNSRSRICLHSRLLALPHALCMTLHAHICVRQKTCGKIQEVEDHLPRSVCVLNCHHSRMPKVLCSMLLYDFTDLSMPALSQYQLAARTLPRREQRVSTSLMMVISRAGGQNQHQYANDQGRKSAPC